MDENRRCTATSKRSGERCGRAAITGGTVCAFHGGKASQVVAAARRRNVEAEALVVAERLDVVDPERADPQMVLLGEVDRVHAVLVWVAAELAEATPGSDRFGALIGLLGSWSDRAVKVSTEVGRLGIGARRVEISEERSRIYATAFGRSVAHLPLSEEQRVEIITRFFRELRQLVDSTPDAVMVTEVGEDG